MWYNNCTCCVLEASWNVMAHAQKPDFVFRRNGRVHLNRRGRQFSRLLAAEVCASAVVMLDTTCSEVVWRVLTTHFIHHFPLHLPSRTSPCIITFQLECTCLITVQLEDGFCLVETCYWDNKESSYAGLKTTVVLTEHLRLRSRLIWDFLAHDKNKFVTSGYRQYWTKICI